MRSLSTKKGAEIVLLSSGSMFLEGVARRLEESGLRLTTVSASAPDLVQRLQDLLPRVIVTETSSTSEGFSALLDLNAVATPIICLDLQRDDIQVCTKQRIAGASTERLVALIRAIVSSANKGFSADPGEPKTAKRSAHASSISR